MAKSVRNIEKKEGYSSLYMYIWYRATERKEILLIRQPQKRRAFGQRVDKDL
jgi:hypothetical protein